MILTFSSCRVNFSISPFPISKKIKKSEKINLSIVSHPRGYTDQRDLDVCSSSIFSKKLNCPPPTVLMHWASFP